VEDAPHWGFRGLESFNFYLSNEDVDMPLMDAITKRLEMLGRDPKDVRDLNRWSDFTDEQRADIERTWESHSRERLLYMQNMSVTLKAMKLVANALLYLSQYPEDSEPAWQEGTPRGYMEKYQRQSADPKARAKTLSRAQHEGFTIIRKVGKLFEQMEAGGEGESPSPHLRRAHWRRQAYGPKLSLRKLMWIRAVRVLGGNQRERPYLVAGAEASAP